MSHCHDHSGCHSNNGCGCGCHSSQGNSSCGSQKSCSCESCRSKQGDCNFASKFLEIADCAWMEVLKEKIKEHIKANAKNLDELAGLIAQTNHEKWKKKMENNKCCETFEEKLNNFFGQECGSQCQTGNNPQGNQNKKH